MAKNKWPVICCCSFLTLLIVAIIICILIATIEEEGCLKESYRHAAVAADSKICSSIGRNIIQEGGSAVDGAIAALLCTSVVNPQSMGIGGGSIVAIRNETGKVSIYNFRETVPKSFKSDLLRDCRTTFGLTEGSQWIGVPGEVRGYEAIHKQYGRLPWAKLFEPTIKLARDGIPMPSYLATLLNTPMLKKHVENSSLCEILCHKNKTILGKDDVLKFPKLAETLEIIAKQGPEAFYSGKIGHDLIEDIKAAGGPLTMEDLKDFKVQIVDAQTISLGGTKMHFAPPPAGGALVAFILQIMRGFSLTSQSLVGKNKIQFYHRFIEAVKFANGQKRNIRDPLFNPEKSVDHLIDSTFIDRIRKMITSNANHNNSYYSVEPSTDRLGTTHVSVLDKDGLAVSATSTINELFGAGVYSPRTGIILNNELVDFCGRADVMRTGERPPSSMTPSILEKESGGIMVIGGSGGSMITTAVTLSIINHLWLGMSLKNSIRAPIVFVDSKNYVNFEPRFDRVVQEGIKGLGHKIGNWSFFLNVVNALEKDYGCIRPFSDRRKNGMSDGY